MSRIAGLVLVAALMVLVAAFPARAQVQEPPKTPTADGTGGSAATVDPLATQTAIDVLRSGGNAVDAAVAAAGVLGVTEPFSSGIGGGGFMVIYDARRHKVDTIDSREAAPQALAPRTPSRPYIGGTDSSSSRASAASASASPAPWPAGRPRSSATARARCARCSSRASGSRDEGFVTDATFASQVKDNEAVFDDFTSSRETYLNPDGTAPPAGSLHRNPDMADTYRRIGQDPSRFYRGAIARDIARTVQQPPETAESDREVAPGR